MPEQRAAGSPKSSRPGDTPDDTVERDEGYGDDGTDGPGPPPDGDGTPGDGTDAADPSPEGLRARLDDEASARDLGDFVTSLEEALAPFLSSKPLSVQGNFFLGETRFQDAVAGDKYSAARAMAFSGRIDSGRVPPPVLEEIRATFVAPRGQRELEERLARTAVVLLRVPADLGATTSALRALDRVGKAGVWKLNPEVRLGSLRVDYLEEGGGYFVESLEPEQAAALRPFHLERLSTELRERHCHLVVRLVPGSRSGVREGLDSWLLEADHDPPDTHELVRSHVARHLDAERDDPRLAFLDRADVRGLVDDAGTDGLPLRRIADLAALLSLVGRGQAEVADVRSRFSSEGEDLFRNWFDDEREAGRLPFVLALAVLDQLQEGHVDRAHQLLEQRVRAREGAEGDTRPCVFQEPRRTRLAAARAECYDTVAMTPYGPSPVRALRYLDDGTAPRVLRQVWQEHGEARRLLLDWLGELATDRTRIVRLRAGGALGLLSLQDFDLIRREVLLARAGAEDARHREVVLAALRVPARDPALAPLVSRLVEDWSRPSQPHPIKWTAARALGASVGRTMAARALRLLERLATEPSGVLVPAVVDSVTELFMDPEKDLTGTVLDQLLTWTQTEQTARVQLRDAGIACFLRLCNRVRVEVPDASMPWPTMLWLVSRDERRLDQVATLLHRTLDAPRMFASGYELLRRWVRLTRQDPRLREPLLLLVPAIARTPQDTDALRHRLVDWSADDGGPTETVDLLLVALEERAATGGADGKEYPQ
ncbi:hypothetical protein ACFTXB_14465 [Streptomyces sp. NPDC057074]|uniref:hypothetical protein n=1 Tax=Streptomyces sp. NPDC057074 TaxID=3346015 RepID=UPI00362B3825